MATYDDLAQLKTEHIRKAIGGSVFVASAAADGITTLTTGAGAANTLTALPSGWEDLGYLTNDGMGWATETSESNIESFQSLTPTRTDMLSETSTLTVTAQETKALAIGLYSGIDLATLRGSADATSGEVKVSRSERPSAKFYHVLGLAVDETENGAIYIGRYLPRAKITARGEQAYTKGDTPISYPFTFTGFKDSTLGTSEQFFFGGPGWFALLDSMGFDTTP